VCFPFCDGGCTCTTTASGAQWACVTDLSCAPVCSPLDALDGACDPSDADLGDDASPSDAGASVDAE
jgi:hypothetical protein